MKPADERINYKPLIFSLISLMLGFGTLIFILTAEQTSIIFFTNLDDLSSTMIVNPFLILSLTCLLISCVCLFYVLPASRPWYWLQKYSKCRGDKRKSKLITDDDCGDDVSYNERGFKDISVKELKYRAPEEQK